MMSIFLMMIFLFLILNFLNLNMMMILIQIFLYFFIFKLIFILINLQMESIWIMNYFSFGLDKISLMLLILSFWIICLMILSIMNLFKFYINLFLLQCLFLLMFLFFFFFSLNLINFYLFFEMSLIPILIMVLGWGGYSERLMAGIYMLMYTMFFSLPFFLILMFLNLNFFSLNIIYLKMKNFMFLNSMLLYYFFMLIFLVKLPIYMIHLWLPKAHVEAPVFGSMILAGILLKLGGYGLIRLLMIFNYFIMKNNLFLIIYVFIGSINISIMCLRQIDLKMLIAYSSIVHMGIMLVGLLMNFSLSFLSCLMMMISHGLCSSALFCLLNFNYKRLNSRSLMFNKGMMNYFSNMSLWWFMFCIFNMAAPPSLNLVSEIFLIMIIMKFSLIMMILIFLLSFFSGVYSIYLFSFTQHGMNLNFKMFSFNMIDEFLLMYLHWFPLFFFILNLNLF